MKVIQSFLKWWALAFIMLGSILAVKIIAGKMQHTDYLRAGVIILIGAVVLAIFFLLVEYILVPWRKRLIFNKVLQTFNAKPIDRQKLVYECGGLQFFIQISIRLNLSLYSSGVEQVEFHISRAQYDELHTKPIGKLQSAYFDNIPTYIVHHATPAGVKRAKKKLDKIAVAGDYI